MNARVLVLSHNPFSKTQNNGKTLESFFQEWDRECLAQIFIRPAEADFSFCDSYYCMSDYEVLNQFLSRGKIGTVITGSEGSAQAQELDASVHRFYGENEQRKKSRGLKAFIRQKFSELSPPFVFAREEMWRHARWDTDELNEWIRAFRPDVLFFQGSSCSFAYNIALTICGRYALPLVLELTDDYTYYRNRFSLFDRINKKRYLSAFRKGICRAETIITISSYMAREYSARFGGNYRVLMNSVSDPCFRPKDEGDVITLLYAGNVTLNRWKVLLSIGLALDALNESSGKRAILNIYTPSELDAEIRSELAKSSSIVYGGTLNAQQLLKAIEDADFLVHVESFDEKMKKVTRLSISTKIPEYLAANRCIFAVGPGGGGDVASIAYLRDNNAAVVSGSGQIEDIKENLMSLFEDRPLRDKCIENAKSLFMRNHRAENTRATIKRIVDDAVGHRSAV